MNQREWHDFNKETVEALIADGSNPEAEHEIEHHIASDDFAKLEKAAVEAFKLGYEVTDAEELVLDDGGQVFSFDAIIQRTLDLDQLNQDTDKLLKVADDNKVHYDGWGTYFVE